MKSQPKFNVQPVDSPLKKTKVKDITLLDVVKPPSASPSSSIHTATNGFTTIQGGLLRVISYGQDGTQKFYPWQMP
jgi:hypothetical protein